jgi:hypothetical protein
MCFSDQELAELRTALYLGYASAYYDEPGNAEIIKTQLDKIDKVLYPRLCNCGSNMPATICSADDEYCG